MRTRGISHAGARGRPRSRAETIPTDIELGATIRNRRKERNLHLDALAASAGIDPRVLSRIERGERPCRVSEFSALSAGLGVAAEDLLQEARRCHVTHIDSFR